MGIDLNRFKGKRNQEWLDWLQDDPIPAAIRNRMRENSVKIASQPIVRRVGQSTPEPKQPITLKKSDDSNKTVSIHIALPDLSRAKRFADRAKQEVRKRRPSKRIAVSMASVFVVGTGILGISAILSQDKPKGTTGTAVLSEKTEKPSFEYSLPKDKESELSESVRYDATKKVVNYQDSIGGVNITVSQQPLPSSFSEDTENKVKKLAEDFSAKDILATANPTAYRGTSADGPQTVIFSKKGLLVFIQSVKEIDDHDWAEYITNLE